MKKLFLAILIGVTALHGKEKEDPGRFAYQGSVSRFKTFCFQDANQLSFFLQASKTYGHVQFTNLASNFIVSHQARLISKFVALQTIDHASSLPPEEVTISSPNPWSLTPETISRTTQINNPDGVPMRLVLPKDGRGACWINANTAGVAFLDKTTGNAYMVDEHHQVRKEKDLKHAELIPAAFR
jgi:hypothetical protein